MLAFLITQCMYLVKVLGCLSMANTHSLLIFSLHTAMSYES